MGIQNLKPRTEKLGLQIGNGKMRIKNSKIEIWKLEHKVTRLELQIETLEWETVNIWELRINHFFILGIGLELPYNQG